MTGLTLVPLTLREANDFVTAFHRHSGAGWKMVGETKPSAGWSREGRGREWNPIYGQLKFRWEAAA